MPAVFDVVDELRIGSMRRRARFADAGEHEADQCQGSGLEEDQQQDAKRYREPPRGRETCHLESD